MILVADIGGTNARFAIASVNAEGVSLSHKRSFRVSDFDTPVAAARAYLASTGLKPRLAAVAMAARITDDDRIEFTNSRWHLDISAARRSLGLDRLVAINDFEALATGVRSLPPNAFVNVKPGTPVASAPVVVLGPGTGFGQALIVPFASSRRVIATQGGQIGFAPHGDEEAELLRVLSREFGHVPVERVVSGPGLLNIYRFLLAFPGGIRAEIDGVSKRNSTLQSPFFGERRLATPEDIVHAATSSASPLAAKTVDMFCAILGAVVGDAVLATGALGGAILGGGVSSKIHERLLTSAFIERFRAKGLMRAFVEDVPIDLIVSDDAALFGAAIMMKEREGAA